MSQDNSIKDLEHKVKILSEKLRISEEKLNSDLHLKHFGTSTGNIQPVQFYSCSHCPAPSPPTPACRSACPSRTNTSPACSACRCSTSSSCSHDHANQDPSINGSSEKERNDINRILTSVDALKVDVLQIKAKLASLVTEPTDATGTPVHSVPDSSANAPTSQVADAPVTPENIPTTSPEPDDFNKITVEAEIHIDVTDNADISNASIEEFIPDSGKEELPNQAPLLGDAQAPLTETSPNHLN